MESGSVTRRGPCLCFETTIVARPRSYAKDCEYMGQHENNCRILSYLKMPQCTQYANGVD